MSSLKKVHGLYVAGNEWIPIKVDANGKIILSNIPGHHEQHEDGGSDEISVASLSGLLADSQNPLGHHTSHEEGGSDVVVAFITGMILMWSGSIATIPSGWHLCDGTNGTPDLRDKFVVGAGSTYNPGNTGGENTHTLTTAEMPAHTHNQSGYLNNAGGNRAGVHWQGSATGGYNWPVASTGNGGAHENRPPYYALAYIMKL